MMKLTKEQLHHAHVIYGPRERGVAALRTFVEDELDMSFVGHPDVRLIEEDRLSIERARMAREIQQMKAVSGLRKVIVLSFDQATREAQNALLKVLEEPTEGTHFFLITPNKGDLLPTLLSRVDVIDVSHTEEEKDEMDPGLFVTATMPERLTIVQPIIDEHSRGRARQFLDGLVVELRDRFDMTDLNDEQIRAFEEIAKAKGYLLQNGSSIKQILHHIAMIVPRVT